MHKTCPAARSGLAMLLVSLCAFPAQGAGPPPGSSPGPGPGPDAALRASAERLHGEAIVIDTHNDITSAILDDHFDLGMAGEDPKWSTHTDLRRMRAGGLGAEFFAIFVDARFIGKKPAEGGGATRRALDMVDSVYEQIRRHPEALELALTSADIRRIRAEGRGPAHGPAQRPAKIAALMGIEGGHAIEDSLGALRMFYRLGVRYMTLTHVNTNDWADSSGDIDDPRVAHHGGLTAFGKEVVREMNRLGMMVDVSHVSDKTFYDVLAVSRAPVIASHSSARAIAPHPRNLSDDMLRAIARNGGVVMVNFFDGFLDPRKVPIVLRAQGKAQELERRYPNDHARVRTEVKRWMAAQDPGLGKTPLSVLVDHIVHVARVAGVDHVGLGSDFDGVSALPAGMEDVSRLPGLTLALLQRGYSAEDIRKVLGENLLRAMAAVEREAHAPAR